MTCPGRLHGTATAYRNHGCVCPAAKDLARRQVKRASARRARGGSAYRPVVGTARRLQALAWMGWSARRVAQELGVTSESRVCVWRDGRTGSNGVRVNTAVQVADLYDRLAMHPGPCPWAKAKARREGWVGPLAWDDIDDPDAQPNTAGPSDHHRYMERDLGLHGEEVAEMTRQGRSADVIAARLGCAERTVVRLRARLRKVAC